MVETAAVTEPEVGLTSPELALTELRRVALVIDHGAAPFESAIACEVFGIDRTGRGVPPIEFSICSPGPGPVQSSIGMQFIVPHRLEPLAEADLVLVGAITGDYQPPPALVEALNAAVAGGAMVASMCSGAFVLGRAGLLDGRRSTTHWLHAEALQREFPQTEVVPNVLYVIDGPIATSAGTAAGIDLCLHLVRQVHGSAVANTIARQMVVPPHREGGQAQFVTAQPRTKPATTLAPVLDWALEHLDQELSVAQLAQRAAMSERTFARRFHEETGTTPHHWVLAQRVAEAERLLETTDAPIDEVARACGFGSATMLRHHFSRLRGTSPSAYRRAFAGR